MKKVVKTITPVDVVTVESVNENKIYAFKTHGFIYKAHKLSIGPGIDHDYAFVDLSSSDCWANGKYSSLEKLISNTLEHWDTVYEFDNMKEFAEWFVKNV